MQIDDEKDQRTLTVQFLEVCQLLDKCTHKLELQQKVNQLKQKLADGEEIQSDDISVIHLLDDSNEDKDKLVE